MQTRLLFINCPSKYFLFVPMGTFGVCDYLSKKNIPVRILNLSLYDHREMEQILEEYLNLFKPTHIGLIFHWQETAEGLLWVGEYIRSRYRHLKIICGGFTAGYFGENLLKKCSFIDYIIKGDPEQPLNLLLRETDPVEIPNLIYRDSSAIHANELSYFIDQDNLSQLSFCEPTYLHDHELYIKAIEQNLGFPIFIGRGCEFNCTYCGGSRGSFKLHSEREKPVVRAISSVIADLKRLKNFTNKIYICYENNRDYIKELFEALLKEKFLIKAFQLNYGAWHLPDNYFFELYKHLFIYDETRKPLFELSPEIFNDNARKEIKNHNAFYTIQNLKETLSLITDQLGEHVRVSVFFSRYHDVLKTYTEMKREIANIFRLQHELFINNLTYARVHYDHLSTDIASQYWEKYVEHPRDFDTLMSASRKLKAQESYSFPVNNFFIYAPDTLSEKELFKCELLIKILKIFENHFHEMFHVIFQCLGDLIVDLIEEIIAEEYLTYPGNIFKSLDEYELLNVLKLRVQQKEDLLCRIPFMADLTDFSIKKALCQRRPQTLVSFYQNDCPKLNQAFISENDYDYLDLYTFLDKLKKEDPNRIPSEKTVFIFLADEILSMSYITYRSTLKTFENGFSLDDYYVLMRKRRIFTIPYHKELISKLFKNNVLY